jgi:alpha-D-ribose 1-methylphosphonate 5-triphosphate diphosphatase PhnM
MLGLTRAEGKEVNRLQKYIERTAAGRELRTAYAMTRTALPEPRPGSQWREEAAFSAADEVLASPGLKTVFKTAIERGFAVMPETAPKAKGE